MKRKPLPNELELANRRLAFKAAVEGMVLLKNESSCLPLTERRVALYGAGAAHSTKGGTGSGEVNNRDSVNVLQGLRNHGFEITTTRYLGDYEKTAREARKRFKGELRKAMKGISRLNEHDCFWALDPVKESFPDGRKIDEEDFRESGCSTAIYVLTRQAGEGRDRHDAPGDFRLSENEIANIAFVANHYEKSILVINAGSSCDLSPLTDLPLKAIVFFGQPGEEGGNALAALLAGECNFSGKLTATWYKKAEDHPLSKRFSYLSGQTDYEEYAEGIYVGYRYCDAFGQEPLYPFGYGLSYTSFAIKGRMEVEKTTIRLEVEVDNVGKRMGAEVVEAYIGFPDGRLPREKKALVGFARTGELESGQSETVVISFDLTDFAYYDESEAAYFLDEGNYPVYVSDNGRDLIPVGQLILEGRAKTEQAVNIAPLKDGFPEIEAPRSESAPLSAKGFRVKAKDIATLTHEYGKSTPIEGPAARMDIGELSAFVHGYEAYDDEEEPYVAPGCAGKSNPFPSLKYGLPVLAMADGPAGLRLVPFFHGDGKSKAEAVPCSEKLTLASRYFAIREIFRRISFKPRVYRFATAFPVGIVLAQSFDVGLLEEIGKGVSREMDAFGVDIWLAPGLNIMRHPLCGRNFEYFSEDPVLSGKLAAAISRGVGSNPRHTVTFKHFCCNNQEDNRLKSDSRVHERALREIYLRGFRIAIREGKGAAVMTSYNKVNGVYTNSSVDLVTTVLREEWGFDGIVMTDWGSVAAGQAVPHEAIAAGTDIIMPGNGAMEKELAEAIGNGLLEERKIRESASRLGRFCLERKGGLGR